MRKLHRASFMTIPYIATVVGLWMMQNAWAAMLIYHVLVLIVARHEIRPTLKRKKLNRLEWAAVAAALCGGPGLYFLWPMIGGEQAALAERMAFFGLTGGSLLFFVLWFSIIHPVLEESLWRSLDPKPWQLFCGQDLCFAGYHGLVVFWFVQPIWIAVSLVVLVSSSMFWRWLTWKTGSRWPAFAMHAAADASILVGIAVLSSR